MTLLVNILLSSSNSACADETKETFCEAESVIKPYLKILANFLHGEKHAVDKVEQILWYNNQHLMYHGYCLIGHTFTIGLM